MTQRDTEAVRADQLRFRRQRRSGRWVLDQVSLRAYSGQWTAIIGPNGAGKSTLLRLLAGLDAPHAGQVSVMGASLSSLSNKKRARQLSWLGQQHEGDDAMLVRDLVALGRMPHLGWMGLGTYDQQDDQAIERALLDTDMADLADRRFGELSSGEKQRANLARALAAQAPVMLLDEPVAHLDAPHQRTVAHVLRREAQRGRCVISVLHELPMALQADQLVILNQGAMVAQGASNDPTVHRALERVFNDAVRITQVDQQWAVLPRF